ncbi:MAG TPA: type II toxin-antitoxin system CcdA family antitoxin [Paraburkholderia sp.]|nr:type II toxin-antitoxin system CcdA family antitoxin [Paraburkholderia sp.]
MPEARADAVPACLQARLSNFLGMDRAQSAHAPQIMANYAHNLCTWELRMVNAFIVPPDPAGVSVVKPRAAAQAQNQPKVTRKPTNVSLPANLLERARDLNVNVSRASERGVREAVEAAEARAWAEKNADFIAEMNARIEHDGLPLEEYRMF